MEDEEDVLGWKVELLTLDDCLSFLGSAKPNLEAARKKLVQIKHPCLNEVNLRVHQCFLSDTDTYHSTS